LKPIESHKCLKCGNLADFVPEVEEGKVKDFLKNLKKKDLSEGSNKLVDTSPGYGVGVYEFIILPLIGLFIFILVKKQYILAFILLFVTISYIAYLVKRKRK